MWKAGASIACCRFIPKTAWLRSNRTETSQPAAGRSSSLTYCFRLRHILGAEFSAAVAMPYVGGALIAVCSCWAGVTLYFFRRYTLSAWTAPAIAVILLVYKIAVIGW